MGKLDRLYGKSEKVVINEVEMEIKPLKVKDMQLFFDLSDENKRVAAMQNLIKKVIKEAIPGTTDEEILDISVEHLQTIVDGIMKVNGLEQKLPTLK